MGRRRRNLVKLLPVFVVIAVIGLAFILAGLYLLFTSPGASFVLEVGLAIGGILLAPFGLGFSFLAIKVRQLDKTAAPDGPSPPRVDSDETEDKANKDGSAPEEQQGDNGPSQ